VLHQNTLDRCELLAEHEEDELGAHLTEMVNTGAEHDLFAHILRRKVLNLHARLMLPLASIAIGVFGAVLGLLLGCQLGFGLLVHLLPPALEQLLLLHVLLEALFMLCLLLSFAQLVLGHGLAIAIEWAVVVTRGIVGTNVQLLLDGADWAVGGKRAGAVVVASARAVGAVSAAVEQSRQRMARLIYATPALCGRRDVAALEVAASSVAEDARRARGGIGGLRADWEAIGSGGFACGGSLAVGLIVRGRVATLAARLELVEGLFERHVCVVRKAVPKCAG